MMKKISRGDRVRLVGRKRIYVVRRTTSWGMVMLTLVARHANLSRQYYYKRVNSSECWHLASDLVPCAQ